MQDSDLIYPSYMVTWRNILVGWLGWSEERFSAWVAVWESRIRDNVHGWADWFYHEDELYYVLPLLVREDLARRLAKQRTRRMYDDLAELLFEELEPAIAGRPTDAAWGTEAFDWAAAKQRVEAVLRGYGSSLPSPAEEGDYEKRALGNVVR